MNQRYIFKSDRLGFRNWTMDDLPEFAALNEDERVMEHFPKPLTHQETEAFINRLRKHFDDWGYTYYATEVLETGTLIGFIGLAYQTYEAEFTPAVDIGWRLKPSAWGKGYATEGAKRCLEFAFEILELEKIVAVFTANNKKSENVMKKIGMTRKGEFNHPALSEYPDLERCIWYEIERNAIGIRRV